MLAMMHPFTAPTMMDHMMADMIYHTTHHDRHPRVQEGDDAYSLTIAAPGVRASDVEVTIDEGVLKVAGQTNTRVTETEISLPHNADADQVSVGCVDGLITVTMPKLMPPAPTNITVDTSPPSMSEGTPHYTLTLSAPGLAANDIVVQAKHEAGSLLKINGETKRTGARLDRTFRLPRDADADLTQASHVDGLLTLSVPKKAVTAQRIPIKAASDTPPNHQEGQDSGNHADDAAMVE